MSDPKDIIIEAIHSAFVKYPKEDDPASHDHWISPADSAAARSRTRTARDSRSPVRIASRIGDLAKVVILELEAAGYQILKKGAH
jgi:hypothetical protein